MRLLTRTSRGWIRRTALGLAVAGTLASAAQAASTPNIGADGFYAPSCGGDPGFCAPSWDTTPNSTPYEGTDSVYQPVIPPGPLSPSTIPHEGTDGFYNSPVAAAPWGVIPVEQPVAAAKPVVDPTTGSGIDWGDAGVGVAIGAALGLLVGGAALALNRRRRTLAGT
jgi:hypothetical protein